MNNDILHIAIPEKLKNDIKELAIKRNVSLNALVRLILSEYLEKEE